jgi:hypothetical protein
MWVPTVFLLFFVSVALSASNFTTTGCVDAAGTQTCITNAIDSITSACQSACGCENPFSCANANYDCLAGCVCEGYKDTINCVLSSCWNKVRGPIAKTQTMNLCLIFCHRLGILLRISTAAYRCRYDLSHRGTGWFSIPDIET